MLLVALALSLVVVAQVPDPAPATPSAIPGVDLGIAPVTQVTPVWCWVAVGEMVFRHIGVPSVNTSYQCGVMGAVAIGTAKDVCARDCTKCNVPGGDATTVMGMLVEYPRRVALLTKQKTPRLFATHTGVPSPSELRAELDAGNPIVAGINPQTRPARFAASQHTSLVVGYRVIDGALWLLVNDPFPFSPLTWADPYLAIGARELDRGRYGVRYDDYVTRMGWVESFLVRTDGAHPAQ